MNQRNNIIGRKTLAAILLLGISLASAYPVYGAKPKDLVIEYNFLNGDLTSTVKGKHTSFVVKKGRNIVFKIINFNRSVFKATINGELITNTDFTKSPGLFSTLITPKAKTGQEKESSAPAAAGASLITQTPLERVKTQIDQLNKIKKLWLAMSDILYKAETFTQLEIQKNQLFIAFMDWTTVSRPPLATEVLNKSKTMVENAKSTIGDIKKGIETHVENGKKLLEDIKALSGLKTAEEINKKLKQINNESYKKALDEYAQKNSTWKELFAALFQLENVVVKFEEKKYIDEIKTILDNVKPENFSVSLTIPTVNSDEVKITVKIEPSGKTKAQVFHQLKDPIIVKVEGGWKIDFSTGVFFHLNAQDATYWYDNVPANYAVSSAASDPGENSNGNGTSMVILMAKENKKSITPVVGALMHIYPRQIGSVKWSGIAFGLGTGEADKLSFYLGTGMMLGSKSRFLINAGVTAVSVESLLPKYEEKLGQEIELPAEDVIIVKAGYKLRLFVSLTYNL
jgi:hypothetical protein